MDWTTVINLIDPKFFIVVVACWVLGYILKQTPKVPDWSIVYIVSAFALGFTVWMIGVTAAAILQGILCGAVAVYGNQLIKQAKKADGDGQ
jgi:hypothetical protein